MSTTALSTDDTEHSVGDDVIKAQRAALAAETDGAGYGPQAPRDIDAVAGTNTRVFESAPAYTQMNLCNIHFHEGAEHKGGQFKNFAGNGDGHGYGSGYVYSGT
ncbi:MAG: delta-class carbonic anhydrase, partial [Pseudomonadota bacterium]